jgi:glycosyltransferase involved in cell wall biosynthesis
VKILVVHPVLTYLGGGESLCLETIRVLLSHGHEITLLSEAFNLNTTEKFLGFNGLFTNIDPLLYPSTHNMSPLGSYSHIMAHLRGQRGALDLAKRDSRRPFDVLFSTQDPAYIPDLRLPVIQWGYFPHIFSRRTGRALHRTIRDLPLRVHYRRKVRRIGLVVAFSEYSKQYLDKEWKRPSVLVYPPCNMVKAGQKRDLVITAGRAVPAKRFHLLWQIARLRPQYQFLIMAVRDPHFEEYASNLAHECPDNGKIVFDAPKEAYYRFLGEAKVYVHLMESELFGITIVEAMSSSCVPIVHDSGAPREIVDSRTGFRWRQLGDLPTLIDEAIAKAPSVAASMRAEEFSRETFDKKLSSVLSGLRV